MKEFKYRLRYKGLNSINLVNFLIKNNIDIQYLNQNDSKEIEFLIDSYNYKKLKKINSPYKLQVLKRGGIRQLLNLFLKRIGVVIGILIICIAHIFVGNRVMYINILGCSDTETVRQVVLDYGVNLGKINNLNTEDLEKYLINNLSNLSLVSVKTKGNALIINVMEKENLNKTYECFYAPYNMVIKEISVLSGTPSVRKDSVVKKGDILVEPYTINANGERIMVEARAKIIADVWFCGSENTFKENIQYVRTGNKKIFSQVFLNKIKNTNYVSPYDSFETETYNINLFKNHFLPIKLFQITFYETEKIVENFNFDENKNEFLEKSKQKAYDILPENVIINEVVQNISELEDRYIFQTYLKSTMEITNED